MRQVGTISLIVCLAATSGCNICCWGKRATELTGPTDIRQSHYWCLGEDAVFAQPMGPSRNDYGLKPTCWREWPADGARCSDDSCGPIPVPDAHLNGTAPTPEWEQTAPAELEPEHNPFLDDAELLPAPASTGAQLRRPVPNPSLQTRRPKSNNLNTPINAPPTQSVEDSIIPINQNAAMNIPRRLVAARLPWPTGATTPPLREEPSIHDPPLKITVSAPIDTPVQFLAPAERPRGTVVPAVATSDLPAVHEATLASLEQMIDTMPSNASTPAASGAKVIVNDFAPGPQPFRLATRDTLNAPENDTALESKTLSALKSMMSGDAAPAASR
jgi:hypothetical protein